MMFAYVTTGARIYNHCLYIHHVISINSIKYVTETNIIASDDILTHQVHIWLLKFTFSWTVSCTFKN